jgi:beta-glucosidase
MPSQIRNEEKMTDQFPKGFLWGTATASFQIEGYTAADGRGESIWDRFCATPGKIVNGDTGDPACESYVRYPEDIALMQAMGTNAYRFSIAWPRIIPSGDGTVNVKGLDYYDRLVDALLAANIKPVPTLYHWDLPQALQDKQGWANEIIIDAFARYVDVAVTRLGDRVKMWSTLNEPWCIALLGHLTGEHAPGLTDLKTALQVSHNVLVAHGTAVPIIRERCPDGQVGIVLNMYPCYPMMDTEADQQATDLEHARFNLWFLDPLMGRGYPANAWESYADEVPDIKPGSLETIACPLDFLGLNYYSRRVVHDPAGGEGPILHQRDGNNVSARDWEIYPVGLSDLLTWLHKDYPEIPEIIVTENGTALDDIMEPDGKVHDPKRAEFLKQHFVRALKAIEQGVPLTGYFIWTLMDNFEWAFGTSSRFGLAYVDFDTQKRTLKDSGHWFARVARSNALVD